MKQLAKAIRTNRGRLAEEYDRRLRAIGDYGRLPERATRDVAHYDLDLIATCLETGEDRPFVHFAETRLGERVGAGFAFESLQQAITALEETLMPLVKTADTACFLWRMMAQTRALISRSAAAHKRQPVQERARLEGAALEAAANAIVITDRAGQIVWVNPAFTLLTGYSAEEALAQNPRLLKSGQHDEAFYRNLWDTVIAGQVWHGEMVNRRKDGSLYTEDQTITPVRNEHGEISHFIAIKQDITERKQIEGALRQSEHRYRQIIEESADISFTCDPHGRFTFVSLAGRKVIGYEPEELIGRHFTEIIHTEWRKRVQAFYLKQFQERVAETLHEFPLTTKTGEEKWVEQSVKLLTEGNKVVGFQGVVRDITARRRAEQELQAARQRLSDIIDFLPDAFFVIDHDKKVITWNRATEEMTGVTKEQMLGRDDYSVPYYGERRPVLIDLLDADDATIKARYESVEKRGHTLYTEVFVPRIFGGRGGYVAAMAAPLFDSQGKRIGAIESLRDVTEHKRLEQHLQESLERRARQVQTGTEIAQQIAGAPALDELFRRVVTLIKERFNYYHAQLLRYDPALNTIALVTGYGEAGEQMLAAGHTVTLGRGVVGQAAATGKPILATDVTQDPDWQPNHFLPNTRGELAVPIKLGEQVLGILDVQSDQAGALTQDDQLLLEGLCGEIAIAIEDTRLRQEMQERLNELNAMYRSISREGWQTMHTASARSAGYVFDRGTLEPNQDLWLPEIEQAVQSNALTQPTTSTSALVSPLSVRGEVIGALGVLGDPRRRLTPDEMDLIETVSEQVALALEGARLFEQTQAARQQAESRLRETQISQQMTQQISGTLDLERILDALITALIEQMHFSFLQFSLFDEPANAVRTVRAVGLAKGMQGKVRPLDELQNDILMDVARSGKIEVIDGWDDRFDREIYEREGHAALVRAFVPIRLLEQTIGILEAGYARGERPGITPEEVRLLSSLADQVAVAIQNTRLYQQTQSRARREQILRQVTDRIRSSSDPDTVMRLLVSELGTVLNRRTFVRLGSADELAHAPASPASRGERVAEGGK